MNWPTKKYRELKEIEGFIESYNGLKPERNFFVIEERERPDRIVEDKKTGERFGVELTSEYLDNRSVPDRHMNNCLAQIPDNQQYIYKYERRILNRIKKKVNKARQGYNLSYPLILSFYENEYELIYMDEDYWRTFAKRNDKFFDTIDPFVEIVFWPLPNGQVVSVKNNKTRVA